MSGQGASAPRDEAGFTLIETIVALALMAMIAGLLAGGMRGMRQVLGVVERGETSSSLYGVQAFFRAAFAQATPAPGGSNALAAEPALIGDAGSVTFRTSHAPRGQLEGIYRLTIRVEPSATQRAAFDLVAVQTLVRPPLDGRAARLPPARSSRIVTGIAGASFGYFGRADEADAAASWRTSWTVAERLPRTVRLDVTFPAGDGRTWTPLDLPLQLADQDTVRCGARQPC